jgi:prophage DNA circulation protein
MTAPAGFQKGTFRGLAFVTEGQQANGGRRLVVHEFPQSEDHVVEELGRKAKRFSLDLHIRGADFIDRANAFEDALDAPGDGMLVHPWRGTMRVSVDDYSRTDSSSDGGITTFSVQFVKSGLPASPAPSTDTAAVATGVAATTIAGAPAAFASGFNVVGATAFVEGAANDLIAKLGDATAIQAGLLGGAGPALRTFQDYAARLGAGELVRDAAGLGLAIVNLVGAVSALGESAPGRIEALRSLLGFGDDFDPIPGDTPARNLQASNEAAFVQLVNVSAASELIAAIAATPFGSYDDAIALRDGVADQLSALSLRQADVADDTGSEAFDALRRAMIADVAARAGTLARLQSYTPATTEPALTIAYRLYGDANRDLEIVDRNRIDHPGFVQGGVALHVLTPSIQVANG